MARADPRVPTEILVAALVGAASLPLLDLFSSGGAGEVLAASVVLSALVAWALRRARIPVPAAAVLSAAAFAWFATALFFRHTMWGPFPSGESMRALGSALELAVRSARTEVAPVVATAPLRLLVGAAVWVCVWAVDDAATKLRHPLLAIGICLPIFVFPGTILLAPRGLNIGLFVAAACAMLFSDERLRLSRWGRLAGIGSPGWRPGPAVRAGAVAIVAALALAPLIPGYHDLPGTYGSEATGPGGSVVLSPLVSIRPRLTRTPSVVLFSVESPAPAYWRITSLDRFDGRVWTQSGRGPTTVASGAQIPAEATAVSAKRVEQRVRIDAFAGPWLPAAWDPVRVQGFGRVLMETQTRSLVPARRIRKGSTFTVTSMVPQASAEELNGLGVAAGPDIDRFKALPPLPPVVAAIAQSVTSSSQTPFERALDLQNYLREFTYDEQVAAGHGYSDLVTFLTRSQRGYCEQFAGAMAVMARMVDLPARVAIGFAVGRETVPGRYVVTSRQAHAWVEIFFRGYGWLAFEPTPRPDGMIVPSYAGPNALSPSNEQTPSANASATPTPTIEPTSRTRELPDPLAGATSTSREWILVAAVVALLLAGALVVPGTAAVRRRLRRRRARGKPRELASTFYLDFLEWCVAARLGKRAGETPSEHAFRLDGILSGARPVRDLAESANDALYAGTFDGDPETLRGLGEAARRKLSMRIGVRHRIASLFGWGWWRAAGPRPPRERHLDFDGTPARRNAHAETPSGHRKGRVATRD